MTTVTRRAVGTAVALCFVLLIFCGGCMNVRGSESTADTVVPKEQFSGKSVAALPVKDQASLSTDSLMSLKVAINEKLDNKLKEKLPASKIIVTKTSVDILNDKGKLSLLDEIIKTYESTGVFDKKTIDALCGILKSDYIVFSRLKAEKMSVSILGKGFGASLEVMIVGRAQKKVVWGGSGEFKRGGILGAGTTQNKQAAEELVNLAFHKF